MNNTTNTRKVTVERFLGTEWADQTPLAGFTLRATETGYEVSDGTTVETFEAGQEADALRTYADFIDTFIGDDADFDYTAWIAARDTALVDADAL